MKQTALSLFACGCVAALCAIPWLQSHLDTVRRCSLPHADCGNGTRRHALNVLATALRPHWHLVDGERVGSAPGDDRHHLPTLCAYALRRLLLAYGRTVYVLAGRILHEYECDDYLRRLAAFIDAMLSPAEAEQPAEGKAVSPPGGGGQRKNVHPHYRMPATLPAMHGRAGHTAQFVRVALAKRLPHGMTLNKPPGNVPHLFSCARLCQENELCWSFTFNRQSSSCTLHTGSLDFDRDAVAAKPDDELFAAYIKV